MQQVHVTVREICIITSIINRKVHKRFWSGNASGETVAQFSMKMI